jgi:NADH-quinone oxidoreductase subunit K
MEIGINHFIFISALLFGLGLYTVITNRNLIKTMLGISLLFSASLLNIAAFSGSVNFDPEGQLILYGVSILIILIMVTGCFFVSRYYRKYKTLLLFKAEPGRGSENV